MSKESFKNYNKNKKKNPRQSCTKYYKKIHRNKFFIKSSCGTTVKTCLLGDSLRVFTESLIFHQGSNDASDRENSDELEVGWEGARDNSDIE